MCGCNKICNIGCWTCCLLWYVVSLHIPVFPIMNSEMLCFSPSFVPGLVPELRGLKELAKK